MFQSCFLSCENNINLYTQTCSLCFFFCGFKSDPGQQLPSAFATSYFHSDWLQVGSPSAGVHTWNLSLIVPAQVIISDRRCFPELRPKCVWWLARDLLWLLSHSSSAKQPHKTSSQVTLALPQPCSVCYSFFNLLPGSFLRCRHSSSGGFVQKS